MKAHPERRPVLTFKGKLAEFFPHDDPISPWMLRLAILRDDLEYEFEPFTGERSQTDTRAVWRAAYAVRKAAVTLAEIKNIFVHEVRPHIKGYVVEWPGLPPIDFAAMFERLITMVDSASKAAGPVRDALGAHVRPEYASPGPVDPTPAMLRTHGDIDVEFQLDVFLPDKTCLHGLNYAALTFAFPDATSGEAASLFETLAEKFIPAYFAARAGIDALLQLFWQHREPASVAWEPWPTREAESVTPLAADGHADTAPADDKRSD